MCLCNWCNILVRVFRVCVPVPVFCVCVCLWRQIQKKQFDLTGHVSGSINSWTLTLLIGANWFEQQCRVGGSDGRILGESDAAMSRASSGQCQSDAGRTFRNWLWRSS